nr:hypothetical protein [Tanacetum cinerariifolium]
MAKGQPKKKKAKKDVFIVNFHFDGIREIKSTQDIAEMMKVSYVSGNEIDMYVEHFGYDIMELVKLEVNQEHNHRNIKESDDEYYGSDAYEEIENVDFQTEGDESVVIKSISTHDPFLTKLCSARIMFRDTVEHHNTKAPLTDPDDHQIHDVNKSGVWVKDTTDVSTENVNEFPGIETIETTNVAEGIGSAMEEELSAPAVDKRKRVELVAEQDSAPKQKSCRPPSHVDGVRIYQKNRGRSKRIANMKLKKVFEFDKQGTRSTPDNAFDVSD